ncbi:uncharacterized protein LOC111612968 [Centruroides sculpturatus]|uniref:uncharacterized protein LOC111612968 n=1 Tax=Centruroides sculpturatus TaxID=218467 RepID=UPI000C6CF380|nr:uncharacterized protein LOC111612968 [Centruroides sculpturatus]
MDYKNYSIIIAKKIDATFRDIIGSTQSAGIRGCTIQNNIMFINVMSNIYIKRKSPLSIFSIDMEKAFDTVNRQILWKLLDLYGLNNSEINKIKLLYQTPRTKIKINNHESDFTDCAAGVRQGCPCSMVLFTIYIETLLKMIMEDKLITPVYIPGTTKKIKYIAHADDINFRVMDKIALNKIIEKINIFSNLTDMRINQNKSKIINIYGNISCDTMKSNTISNIKILGVWYGANCNQYNLNNMIQKIKNALCIWDNTWLYLPERVIVANKILIAKIMYTLYITDLNKSQVNSLEKIIFKYIWQKDFEPISRNIMKNDIYEGGWRIWDIKNLEQALQVAYIINSIKMQDHPLYDITRYILGPIVKCITAESGNNPFLLDNSIKFKKWREIVTTLVNKDQIRDTNKPSTIYKNIFNQTNNSNLTDTSINWKETWTNINRLPAEWRELAWRIINNIVMTREYLYKYHRVSTARCPRCSRNESIFHVFFECTIATET